MASDLDFSYMVVVDGHGVYLHSGPSDVLEQRRRGRAARLFATVEEAEAQIAEWRALGLQRCG